MKTIERDENGKIVNFDAGVLPANQPQVEMPINEMSDSQLMEAEAKQLLALDAALRPLEIMRVADKRAAHATRDAASSKAHYSEQELLRAARKTYQDAISRARQEFEKQCRVIDSQLQKARAEANNEKRIMLDQIHEEFTAGLARLDQVVAARALDISAPFNVKIEAIRAEMSARGYALAKRLEAKRLQETPAVTPEEAPVSPLDVIEPPAKPAKKTVKKPVAKKSAKAKVPSTEKK